MKSGGAATRLLAARAQPIGVVGFLDVVSSRNPSAFG